MDGKIEVHYESEVSYPNNEPVTQEEEKEDSYAEYAIMDFPMQEHNQGMMPCYIVD